MTWLPLAALNVYEARTPSAGFGIGVSALDWWCTQAKVLFLYLKLIVWPWPLVAHYELPLVTGAAKPGPGCWACAIGYRRSRARVAGSRGRLCGGVAFRCLEPHALDSDPARSRGRTAHVCPADGHRGLGRGVGLRVGDTIDRAPRSESACRGTPARLCHLGAVLLAAMRYPRRREPTGRVHRHAALLDRCGKKPARQSAGAGQSGRRTGIRGATRRGARAATSMPSSSTRSCSSAVSGWGNCSYCWARRRGREAF